MQNRRNGFPGKPIGPLASHLAVSSLEIRLPNFPVALFLNSSSQLTPTDWGSQARLSSQPPGHRPTYKSPPKFSTIPHQHSFPFFFDLYPCARSLPRSSSPTPKLLVAAAQQHHDKLKKISKGNYVHYLFTIMY
jgi:hypothetical protein